MLQEYITEGSTVEQAIESGCEKLGLDSFDVTTEILELPKKGFFGKIKSPAKVKITYDDGVKEPAKPAISDRPAKKPQQKPQAQKRYADKTERPAKTQETPSAAVKFNDAKSKLKEKREINPGDAEKKLEIAKEYITSMLAAMGIDSVEFKIEKQPDGAVITLCGENLGIIIGRRGETLDAIQYLVSLAANRIDSGYYRLTIDCGDFREKREQTLVELAEKIANTVIRTGRSTTLEPMNPYERRIIHAVISEKDGVFSRSVGEEPYRKVVISAPGARRSQNGRYNNRRGGQRSKYPQRGARGAESDRTNQPADKLKTAETPDREKLNDVSGGSLYSKIEL